MGWQGQIKLRKFIIWILSSLVLALFQCIQQVPRFFVKKSSIIVHVFSASPLHGLLNSFLRSMYYATNNSSTSPNSPNSHINISSSFSYSATN